MTVTAERTQQNDRVGLSILALGIVLGAEALRLVILSQLRWKLGYPETYAVQGLLFTIVYLVYGGVLVWRGRTLLRRLTAPLLLLAPWLFDSFWLVVNFLQARGSFDLTYGEWWSWLIRIQTVITVVCLVTAWGVSRRRGWLWLVGLVVPVVLTLVWTQWSWRLFQNLIGTEFVFDVVSTVSNVGIPILGILVCWGVEALSRSARADG